MKQYFAYFSIIFAINIALSQTSFNYGVVNFDVVKKIKPEINEEDSEAVLKAVKFQGQERLYNFLLANEEVFDILEKEIKGML